MWVWECGWLAYFIYSIYVTFISFIFIHLLIQDNYPDLKKTKKLAFKKKRIYIYIYICIHTHTHTHKNFVPRTSRIGQTLSNLDRTNFKQVFFWDVVNFCRQFCPWAKQTHTHRDHILLSRSTPQRLYSLSFKVNLRQQCGDRVPEQTIRAHKHWSGGVCVCVSEDMSVKTTELTQPQEVDGFTG